MGAGDCGHGKSVDGSDRIIAARRQKERMPMNLSTVASTCSEITVILAALAMLIKPIRNKLVGQYFEEVS